MIILVLGKAYLIEGGWKKLMLQVNFWGFGPLTLFLHIIIPVYEFCVTHWPGYCTLCRNMVIRYQHLWKHTTLIMMNSIDTLLKCGMVQKILVNPMWFYYNQNFCDFIQIRPNIFWGNSSSLVLKNFIKSYFKFLLRLFLLNINSGLWTITRTKSYHLN